MAENELKPIDNTLELDSSLQSIQMGSLITNTKILTLLMKVANKFAASGLVPKEYQGSPDNCFVACELATRMNVSPMFVMQNLKPIQGTPSWSGQACKMLIDCCGLYEQTKYVFVGTEGEPDFGCYLQAVNRKTKEIIKGTTITWEMVVAEGWLNKNGSKWKTMPLQMFLYRAAAFFARAHCPHVLVGMQTSEEIEDIAPSKTIIRLDEVKNDDNTST